MTLPDGSTVPVRPIQPSDEPALRRFHHRLSSESIYLRHFGVVPDLSPEQAHHFTNLDYVDRFAVVALDPSRPSEIVAVVRFDRDPGTDRAEYAATVEDAWQGKGIGYGLTLRLIEAARERGIRYLYALVLPQNRRMLTLLRDLKRPLRERWQDGVDVVEVDLAETAPGSASS
jgi:GNAT superfamily N-acetyltransferase